MMDPNFAGNPCPARTYRVEMTTTKCPRLDSTTAVPILDDGVSDSCNPSSSLILANRQFDARSKERKVRYRDELEKKVHILQTEATTLSAEITLLQRYTTGFTTENKALKLKLQPMKQQAHHIDGIHAL